MLVLRGGERQVTMHWAQKHEMHIHLSFFFPPASVKVTESL
jgi:hypothetical protein